jgi:hypothetical protein
MTYDTARARVVMVGGERFYRVIVDGVEVTAIEKLADTWEYDGATWVQTATGGTPGRLGAMMTYDAVRERVVLFGGGGLCGMAQCNDTWDYDGVTWVEIDPANGIAPQRRDQGALTYDPIRGRVVLHGGHRSGSNGVFADTWEWDGETWTQLAGASPGAAWASGMTFDAARGRSVLFGGLVAPAGTWTLGYQAGAVGEACRSGVDYDHDGLVGCADDECWGTCAPLCPPELAEAGTCSSAARCGDGICSDVETCRACPADCAVGTTRCPIQCGDLYCDGPTETDASSLSDTVRLRAESYAIP